MKGIQLARTVLRPTQAPPSFLLPAFAGPTLFNRRFKTREAALKKSSFSRHFGSSTFLNASQQGSPQQAGSAEQTTGNAQSTAGDADAPDAPERRTRAHRDISSDLANIISPRRAPLPTRNRGQMNMDSVGSRQGRLAEQLNIKAGADPYVLARMSNNYNVMPPPPPVRLDAYVGRSEVVTKGRGLATAMRMLEVKLSANKVRSEYHQQRFHERPGLKRKRLKSLRWKKRFMEGFKATVSKVIRMRNMGW